MTRFKDWAQGFILMGTLVASGMGLGYWYRGQEIETIHQREIDRIQAHYDSSLFMLANRLGQTADKVDRAAAGVNKKAPPVVVVAPAPVTDHEAIGQAVERANTEIRKQ